MVIEDLFEDILAQDGGSLTSAGLTDYDSVKSKATSEGLQVRVNCRLCGKPTDVIIEWDELVIISLNGPQIAPVLPAGYKVSDNNKSIYFEGTCTRCNNPSIAVHVTPDEAQRRVTDGLKQGFANLNRVNQLAGEVKRKRGG
jgi:hypothetical protein